MKVKHIILIFKLLIPLSLLSQSSYIASDSITNMGIKIISGDAKSNARIIRTIIKGDTLEYNPNQIIEYGLKNGQTYISKRIAIDGSDKQVFLERLAHGKLTLFYYRGNKETNYYLQKDSSELIFLKKTSGKNKNYFRKQLNTNTRDCRNVNDASKLVAFNKQSLTKFASFYNDCSNRRFPYFKYGLIGGLGLNKLSPLKETNLNYLNLFNYNYEQNLTFGVFLDHPIFVSDFSIRLEAFYAKNGFSYNYYDQGKDVDIVINTSSISLPVLLRYTYPSAKYQPFINIGAAYTFHFNNESSIYEALITNDQIMINEVTAHNLIQDQQLALTIGTGLQMKIDYRKSVFIEGRFINGFGLSEPNQLNMNQIQILTGISF